jgi:hypothetical protein
MRPPVTAASLNDPARLTDEIPAASGVTTASALARTFAAAVGEVDGARVLSGEAMEQARTERYRGPDLVEVARPECAVGLGFILPSADRPWAARARSDTRASAACERGRCPGAGWPSGTWSTGGWTPRPSLTRGRWGCRAPCWRAFQVEETNDRSCNLRDPSP